jgi:uncharacterized protein
MPFIKFIFIVVGSISLIVGIIAIVVPGLPTTPFLLLTAGLYVKSSDKLYQKIITNKILGPYILKYQKNKGMALRVKLSAISLMWGMIAVSSFFFISQNPIKLIIVAVGVIGTFVMGFIIPTVNAKDK